MSDKKAVKYNTFREAMIEAHPDIEEVYIEEQFKLVVRQRFYPHAVKAVDIMGAALVAYARALNDE